MNFTTTSFFLFHLFVVFNFCIWYVKKALEQLQSLYCSYGIRVDKWIAQFFVCLFWYQAIPSVSWLNASCQGIEIYRNFSLDNFCIKLIRRVWRIFTRFNGHYKLLFFSLSSQRHAMQHFPPSLPRSSRSMGNKGGATKTRNTCLRGREEESEREVGPILYRHMQSMKREHLFQQEQSISALMKSDVSLARFFN